MNQEQIEAARNAIETLLGWDGTCLYKDLTCCNCKFGKGCYELFKALMMIKEEE